MKPIKRDHILYLEDIVLAMHRIQEYITGLDFKHFKSDHKTVDAVIRTFEIIGEASKNLPPTIKEKYRHVPWEEMVMKQPKTKTYLNRALKNSSVCLYASAVNSLLYFGLLGLANA